MPDINRIPLRMDCQGIDLAHPIDRMPPGHFPYLFNARVIKEGGITGRPGYTKLTDLPGRPNSIRRLNDPEGLFAPDGYIYVGGVDKDLYAGTPPLYTKIDTGYSGDPLSLILFRPDQSPETWMYVFDKDKQAKIRPDKFILPIGIAPPNQAPVIEYGTPAAVIVADGQSASGWSATGGSSSPTLADRTNATAPTIASIMYNQGTAGWCCINPVITQPYWMGNRMAVTLNHGGSNEEIVVVRDVLNAIVATTIESIHYDSGSTGMCSLVLIDSPVGLARNSLIKLNNAEIVRVMEVVPALSGTAYSVRCSTTVNHVATETVTGLISWYAFTSLTHGATETITSSFVKVTHTTGSGTLQAADAVNASIADGRPIDQANDYIHISLFMSDPSKVTDIQVLLSLDGTPNYSFANPGNSLIWTLNTATLQIQGASSASWVDVVVPISSATRYGNDPTRNLSTISGVAIQMTSTGACDYGFDWFYLFGTYGQVIQPNSPVGVVYTSRYRDYFNGPYSIPGPQTRYQLFPLREAVIITPQVNTTNPGASIIDLYRQGGAVTNPLYVGSVNNVPPTPASYLDADPDSVVLGVNQPPDLNAIQPWPVLQPAKSGVVDVIGTSVFVQSGSTFDLNLLSNSVINLSGTRYLISGSPQTANFLELQKSAGTQTGIAYTIDSPTYAAQPLPFVFGPLEGPFAPVVFGLGSKETGGLLYFTDFDKIDSAPDFNFVELATPSNNLVSGAVWNGMCFVGNKDYVFLVRYSYLTSIGAGGSTAYQWSKVPTPSGMWSRWACCSTPIGVCYLGRDGIYLLTDQGGANISDEKLYPLFPHDGQPAKAVTIGTDMILPVDMTQPDFLRISYCDESIRFCYKDIAGNWNTLLYQIYKKRWFLNNYADGVNLDYQLEEPQDSPQNYNPIIQLSMNTNKMLMAGGNDDDKVPINTLVTLPSMDGGDQRSQKLYVDTIVQLESGTAAVKYVATYDNAQATSPLVNLPILPGIHQTIVNLASLSNLALYRNIGAKFDWFGGPDGATLYAWESSGFLQPYLSEEFVTQFFPFSFPGWKHMRRMFPALISNDDVLFTVKAQDGRTFGPFTIPSTVGQYRILQQILPHGIKDLAFALELKTKTLGTPFAFFPTDFTVEVKEWVEESYIKLAVFRA